MALSEQTIRDKVYKRTGLSPAELAENVINEGISSALTEFSRYRLNRIFGLINISEGVIDYPFPNGVTDILDFLCPTETILGNFSFEDTLLMGMQGGIIGFDVGGNIFENPSLVEILFTKLRRLRETIGMPDWTVIDGNPQLVRIGKVPTIDSQGYYEGAGPWPLNKILDKDSEMFFKAVMWKVAEGRANKLAVVLSMDDGSGVRVQPAFEFWSKQSANYEQSFRLDVGADRGSILIG